jgi:hypothetical protein
VVDKIGLKYEILLPESRHDIAEMVARGDLKGSSFSFICAEGGEKWTREGGKSRRLVTKIKALLDCGPVTYPAYRDSSVAVAKRSYEHFIASEPTPAVIEPPTPKIDVSEEMRKCQEFIAERRGFCPTGSGGGIDNSCGSGGKSGGSDQMEIAKKAKEDYDKSVSKPSGAAAAGAVIGATIGAVAGFPGLIAGSLIGGALGAIHAAVKGRVGRLSNEMGISDKQFAEAGSSLFGKEVKPIALDGKTIGLDGGGDSVALITNKSLFTGETGISFHYQPGADINGKLDVVSVEKAAKAVGARTVVVEAFHEKDAKTLESKGYKSVGRSPSGYSISKGVYERKLGKSSRSAGMLDAEREKSMNFYLEHRGFCPTGPGGGVDNSCGGSAKGGSDGPITGSSKGKPLSVSAVESLGKLASKKPDGNYKEWKKGDHKDKSKEKDTQDFLDKAREEQLSKGGKDKGKSDEGGGVQTWSKGDNFPWTTKQVGDKDGYLQGVHPDGSKTEKYPFKDGDTSEAEKQLDAELKKNGKKSSRDRYADLISWYEARGFCPTGPGGGVDNSCGGNGGGGQKPLDANDPSAVKSFLEKMARETGMDLQGRPVPQAKDTAAGGSKPLTPAGGTKTLEQIRLEAAGVWEGKVAEKQAAKVKASREKSAAYKDEMRPLKDALRKNGVGWVDFATKSNAAAKGGQLEYKTRKGSYRVALEELKKGPEAFKAHLDSLGVKRRSVDPRQVIEDTLRFLKDRR